jgi:hypothetical protein
MIKNRAEVIGPRPRTGFQRHYTRLIELRGRAIYQFPDKWGLYSETQKLEIPKEVRKSSGKKPSEAMEKILLEAVDLLQSPLGYVHTQEIVDLTGLEKEAVHEAIVWYVKQGQAILGVSRWGNAVYVKFLKDKLNLKKEEK